MRKIVLAGILYLAMIPCEKLPGQQVLNRQQSNAAECGVYAVLASSTAVGNELSQVDTIDLFDNSFVSKDGSSAEQIVQMANRIGLYAIPRSGLTVQSLQNSQWPVILNFRSDKRADCTGHWVTFLGNSDNGSALIYDHLSANSLRSMNYLDLLNFWTGDGIAVSKSPVRSTKLWIWKVYELIAFLPFLFCVAIVVLISKFAGRTTSNSEPRVTKQLFVLALSVTSATVLIILFQKESLARNQSTTKWIESKYADLASIPRIDFGRLQLQIANNEVLLIDARRYAAHVETSIPDSVNCPIDATLAEFLQVIDSISSDQHLVVYCATSSCDWDQIVAGRLRRFGFNTSVFEPGIQGYIEMFVAER